MTIKKIITLLVLALVLNFTLIAQERKTTIFLVGDSTMCLYDDDRFPQAGWGMPFVHFFNNTVEIENHARGGRSSRSFIEENRWQPIVDKLQPGDYVLIQFGHNDAQNSKNHPDRKTTPEAYKKFIGLYITATREKHATPIIISPVTRWTFDKNGKAEECHSSYLKALKEVVLKHDVSMIDLDTKSRKLLNAMGKTCSRYLYMYFEPGESFKFPDGYSDNTHFTEFGARKMAELVVQGIKELNLELANHLIKPYGTK